jgi:ankyrin repeat protein
LVLLLLERGANVEAAMDNGSKPLYIAAIQGHIQIAKLLLIAHANLKSLNSKTLKTALDQAITNNHLEIVKLLLDAGLDINILSSDRSTPLYLAATYSRIRIVELLLEYGADKRIPLHDGSIVQDHIARGSAVALLLRQPPILKGPSVNVPKRLTSSIDFHTPPLIPTGLGS